MAVYDAAPAGSRMASALRLRRLPMRVSPVAIALLLFAAWGCAPSARRIDLTEAPRLGLLQTPYEIVVFSDFQCPYCRDAAMALKQLHRAYPDKVTIYFKHFPLSQHRQAKNAARAAEAARMQGKFWEMHDLIFDRAESLAEETYVALAASIDLDVTRFKADMASQAVRDHIDADWAEGDAAGLDATPYFIVNGIPYEGSYIDLVSDLKEALGAE